MFRYLPNCRDIKINIGAIDELFMKYGIKKKINTTVEIVPNANGRYNRFMKWQILRLKKCINDPKKFFFISQLLMKRSNVFRTAALNHVFPQ
jgi:hypothetical protein